MKLHVVFINLIQGKRSVVLKEDCFTKVVGIFFTFSSIFVVQLIIQTTNIKEFLEDIKHVFIPSKCETHETEFSE